MTEVYYITVLGARIVILECSRAKLFLKVLGRNLFQASLLAADILLAILDIPCLWNQTPNFTWHSMAFSLCLCGCLNTPPPPPFFKVHSLTVLGMHSTPSLIISAMTLFPNKSHSEGLDVRAFNT